MALVHYVKSPPPKPKNPAVSRGFYISMLLVGIIAIGFAIYPIIVWQVSTLPRLTAKVEKFPIPASQVLTSPKMLESVEVVKNADGFSYFEPKSNADFLTSLSNLERPAEFFLSVPKIKIRNARVAVDSTKFQKNLAHFPGTAIPGEIGNSFITGHSVLSQFADPKNYLGIFTELSKLEVGDDIEISLSGKTLHYVVLYSKVVDPKDTSVLLPISSSSRNLTLMSCVPPGTSLKRLVVITSLI